MKQTTLIKYSIYAPISWGWHPQPPPPCVLRTFYGYPDLRTALLSACRITTKNLFIVSKFTKQMKCTSCCMRRQINHCEWKILYALIFQWFVHNFSFMSLIDDQLSKVCASEGGAPKTISYFFSQKTTGFLHTAYCVPAPFVYCVRPEYNTNNCVSRRSPSNIGEESYCNELLFRNYSATWLWQ